MLICHKLVPSDGAEVLQAYHMSVMEHASDATAAVSIMPAS